MEPSALAQTTGVLQQSGTSWYMNPFFLASFGAFAALGFILVVMGWIIFGRLRNTPLTTAAMGEEERCGTCGLTAEMVAKMIPCGAHSGLARNLDGIEKWITTHDNDYRELRQKQERDYRELRAMIDQLSRKR